MPEPIPSTCPVCGGDGFVGVNNEDICPTCFTTGSLPVRGAVPLSIKKIISDLADIFDKCNDIKEKVDEIKEVVDGL